MPSKRNTATNNSSKRSADASTSTKCAPMPSRRAMLSLIERITQLVKRSDTGEEEKGDGMHYYKLGITNRFIKAWRLDKTYGTLLSI